MKKFIFLFLLCAVSAFAITTAITTSYDDCYAACKSACVEKFSADECQRNCVLMCKTQPEPSLVDTSVIVESKPAVAMRITPQPYPVYSCEEKCKIGFSNCGPGYPVTSGCNELLDQCVKNCQPQVVPRPPVTVMPPVEISCEKRCWMIQDECKKAGVDDASCKMKIDSCLRGCNPQPTPVCDCPPQACEYSCETECGVGYHKCKAAGAGNCGKVVVDCLDQCKPVTPPERCEDQCAKIKQVCREEGLTDEQCEPKLKDCITRCYPRPMPPVARVKSEVSEPLPAPVDSEGEVPPARVPEPVKEKSFMARIWSSIFGG